MSYNFSSCVLNSPLYLIRIFPSSTSSFWKIPSRYTPQARRRNLPNSKTHLKLRNGRLIGSTKWFGVDWRSLCNKWWTSTTRQSRFQGSPSSAPKSRNGTTCATHWIKASTSDCPTRLKKNKLWSLCVRTSPRKATCKLITMTPSLSLRTAGLNETKSTSFSPTRSSRFRTASSHQSAWQMLRLSTWCLKNFSHSSLNQQGTKATLDSTLKSAF